jgi:hypothetical protein
MNKPTRDRSPSTLFPLLGKSELRNADLDIASPGTREFHPDERREVTRCSRRAAVAVPRLFRRIGAEWLAG